jgi:hypothetical protein
MDMSVDEGYGYEWDAMLIGGPADGCLDRAITINGDKPPATIIRIMDGQGMKRESLGEKLIEKLTRDDIEDSQRVAVYELREIDEMERCAYDYKEIVTMGDYRAKYDPE